MTPFWNTRADKRPPLFKRGDLVQHRASRTWGVVKSHGHNDNGEVWYHVGVDFMRDAYVNEIELEGKAHEGWPNL